MNDLFIYIVLGIIQGFTEPLPISSSGHLVVFQTLLGTNNESVVYEAFVNFGSTIAIVIYFFKDIKKLIIDFFGKIFTKGEENKKYDDGFNYVLKMIVATIPLVVVGLSIYFLGISFGDDVWMIAVALIITGILLLIVSNKNGTKSIEEMSYWSILLIGIGQTIAIFPGISRSGITLVVALLLMMNKNDAFKFSFMIYLPASAGALIYSLIEIRGQENFDQLLIYVISAIFAGIFTFIGIKIFKSAIIRNNLKYFSMYCFFLGSLILGLIYF